MIELITKWGYPTSDHIEMKLVNYKTIYHVVVHICLFCVDLIKPDRQFDDTIWIFAIYIKINYTNQRIRLPSKIGRCRT
jgi:hypothetical protein